MNKRILNFILIVMFVAGMSVLMISGLTACKTVNTNDTTPGDNNAPAGHTTIKGGVAHMPGLNDPEANCTACHGGDLQGGSGPSCYSCHGKKW